MDGRPTWTDCDEADNYVVPNALSPRDLLFRPDIMDETVAHTKHYDETIRGLMAKIPTPRARAKENH